jgi:hypothetical protein
VEGGSMKNENSRFTIALDIQRCVVLISVRSRATNMFVVAPGTSVGARNRAGRVSRSSLSVLQARYIEAFRLT